MDELLKYITKYCSFLYGEFGFKILSSSSSESFGNAAIELGVGDFNLQFIRDKGQIFLDFKSNYINEKYPWYSMDIIRQAILGEKEYKGLMDRENAEFLHKNFPAIVNMFKPDSAAATVRQLKALEKIRSKVIFKTQTACRPVN